MKRTVTLPFAHALAALLLAGCGKGGDSNTKPSGGTTGDQSAAASPEPAAGTQGTQGAKAARAGADDDGEGRTSDLLGMLEDLPTQDELDAAAAARIDESMAEAEYEKLKAEIEADLTNPPHAAEVEEASK